MGLTRVLLIVLLKKIAELAQDIQPVYCKVELDIARWAYLTGRAV